MVDKAEARKALINTLSGKNSEPKNSGLAYTKMDLLQSLNYYSAHAKPDSMKAWALAYLHKNHPELTDVVSKAPVHAFITYGALCRLSDRGFDFDQEMKDRIFNYFKEIKPPEVDENGEEVKPVVKKPVLPKVSRSFEAFEMAVDAVLAGGEVPIVSLLPNEPLDDIVQYCKKELALIAENPEYYVQASLKSLKKLFQETLERAEKVKNSIKVNKTKIIRVRKVNPLKVIKDVKFQRGEDTLELRSVNPIDILGHRKMYVYDTKYRKLILFIGTAAGFTFTGTTLKNVDLPKSTFKTVRKPEELKGSHALNISDLHKLFGRLTTKEGPVSAARFNDNWIILKTAP